MTAIYAPSRQLVISDWRDTLRRFRNVMFAAGDLVVGSSGSFGVKSDGNAAVKNASNLCAECCALNCTNCSPSTPLKFDVTFSGISPCEVCQANGPDSLRYTINGNPNATFRIVQVSACNWRLTTDIAINKKFYGGGSCAGTPVSEETCLFRVELNRFSTFWNLTFGEHDCALSSSNGLFSSGPLELDNSCTNIPTFNNKYDACPDIDFANVAGYGGSATVVAI